MHQKQQRTKWESLITLGALLCKCFFLFLFEPTILHLHEWKSRRLHTVAPSWHGHSIPYWYARTIITDCWGAVKDAGHWYGWPIWLLVSTNLCALQIWPCLGVGNTALMVNQSVCRVSTSSPLSAVTDSISLKDAVRYGIKADYSPLQNNKMLPQQTKKKQETVKNNAI